jgi:hypothetical protein
MSTPAATPARPAWWITDACLVVALVLIATKVGFEIAKTRDIVFCDEQVYMAGGYAMAEGRVPAAEDGPLYALWYFALKHVEGDPTRLGDLNWQLLIVLFPCALYALSRTLGATPLPAFLAACALLSAGVLNIPLYVGHYVAVLLLGGTALGVWWRSRWYPILGLTLVLATFIRPEYGVAVLLFLAVGVVRLAVRVWARPAAGASWRGPALDLALLVAGAAGGVWLLGNPLGGGRRFLAFGQHYAINVVAREGLHLDPWASWETIIRRDFGDGVESFGEALRRNPAAVVRHLEANVSLLPAMLASGMRPQLGMPSWVESLAAWLFLAALAGGVALTGRMLVRRGVDEHRLPRLIAGLMLVVTLITAIPVNILVHPYPRHLTPLLALAAALAVAALSRFRLRRSSPRVSASPWAVAVVVVCMLTVIPSRSHGWTPQALLSTKLHGPAPAPALKARTAVEALRRLDIRQPVGALDSQAFRPFLAGLKGRFVVHFEKNCGFWEFVRRNDISLVVIDSPLAEDPRYSDDPEFKAFASGEDLGPFVLVPLPDASLTVALRKDVVP